LRKIDKKTLFYKHQGLDQHFLKRGVTEKNCREAYKRNSKTLSTDIAAQLRANLFSRNFTAEAFFKFELESLPGSTRHVVT